MGESWVKIGKGWAKISKNQVKHRNLTLGEGGWKWVAFEFKKIRS